MENNIKVQVICVTYNQKEYIREALDSFLMQKTNFKFEVLVGDDCSTDGTSEIVAEYASKYPDIIKHIHRESNMGCLANFMDLCERASAKYVAFCDGDDYWTDENKLQKQYDFMEKNEDVNICAHKTFIQADKEWSLYDYYANLKEKFIIPNKSLISKKNTVKNIINEWPHTSSLFVRWKKFEYPLWSKTNGIIGDMPIIFLHIGDKYIYIINEVMSTYRRGVSGVFNCTDSKEEHFLRTRTEYFKILSGLIEYFKANYHSFEIEAFKARLWTEIINYTNAIIKTDRWDKLIELKEEYPDIYEKTKDLLSKYRIGLKLTRILGAKKAKLAEKTSVLRLLKFPVNIIYVIKKILCLFKNALNTICSFFAYWIFALVPKKKNLWVFSGFNKKNYMDNTKYLYEYILKNHPEIKPIWLTRSKEVRKNLKEAKMPVYIMNSPLGIWTMIRASVAFSDHFKMSDYDCRYGFNANTKFVNIFHGFGPKGMKPINDNIPNTKISGVKLSSDILCNNNDNLFDKIIKLIKYPFIAPFRELFEEYFGIVCPSSIFIQFFANPWHTKPDAHIMAGYPRNQQNINKDSIYNKKKLLYAPTYRWNKNNEETLIENFLEAIPLINKFLNENDMYFSIRLHPHTWRNYRDKILNIIKDHPRFSIDDNKELYNRLNEYFILITDYSSLGWEFLLTGNPVIYLAPDINTYPEEECPFDMNYKEICAGKITTNWNETFDEIQKLYYEPDYNLELRHKIKEQFYPAKYNDSKNSERIVKVVKEKLNIC